MLGSDDQRYSLQVMTEPVEPAAGKPVRVRISIVDVLTGEVLPEGVPLRASQPETIHPGFFLDGYGVLARELVRTDQHSYTGDVTFPVSGSWTVQVGMPTSSGHRQAIVVGAVEVE
jgi:hypothetical protein